MDDKKTSTVIEDTPEIVKVTIEKNDITMEFEAFMLANFLDLNMSRTIVLNHSSGLPSMIVGAVDLKK